MFGLDPSMIDIHCHILPGIDDGPVTMDDSVLMARMAAEDGITRIVATPHINFELTDPEEIRSLIRELNQRLVEEGIGISVYAGADVSAMIDPALLSAYTVNKSRYVLVEFPHGHLPASARKKLFALVAAGLRPIVTHPERNRSVISNPELVSGLIETGALIQITAGSLTGDFGRQVSRCAENLLGRGYVHFLATDAHSSFRRPPLLSEAVGLAGRVVGEQAALALVSQNPEAVISDDDVTTHA